MEISQRKSFINIILWKIQMLNTSFKDGENEKIIVKYSQSKKLFGNSDLNFPTSGP